MSKKLKIIIAIILALILALGIYIAPRVIPYTPPNPNIIKTDQGSFELRMSSNVPISYLFYKEHEEYAKDYYNRISSIIKDPNLIINSYIKISIEGYSSDSNNISVTTQKYDLNSVKDLSAMYEYSFRTNKFEFNGFITYSKQGIIQFNTLEELLQTPEYQNLKLK
jgi:hypothetical protein